VSLQSFEAFISADIPKLYRLVSTTTGKSFTIGAEGK
jgi:hypothetical protein